MFNSQTHYLILGNFGISVEVPVIVGVTYLLLLLFLKPEKLSPIASASMVAGIFILNILQILMAIQISKQIFDTKDLMTLLLRLLFYVYHFNILIIVKPLRYGVRCGKKIIVNRQLCIANAFEDYIMEKFPKFHKLIRSVYDTYGYPVSRHIISPERADAVYILMKPLEWMFLIFLYLFDVKPEERIRRQYM